MTCPHILLSVIVPVYNVEKHLENCIDSIIDETQSQYEIILVDDGSTDRSPAICDKYGAKFDLIKVIHKENGGLATARNAGLKIACGEYYTFLDSDDYVDNGYISCIMSNIDSNNDIYAFSFYIDYDETGNSDFLNYNPLRI